jgi:hypothetical protein
MLPASVLRHKIITGTIKGDTRRRLLDVEPPEESYESHKPSICDADGQLRGAVTRRPGAKGSFGLDRPHVVGHKQAAATGC